MSLEQTEKECAANAVAPRVSLQSMEDKIESRHEFTADTAVLAQLARDEVLGENTCKPLSLLSICILVMKNGFTVVGKSAPASAENFNADLGRKLAYEDAIRQLWPLEGYALREELHKKECDAPTDEVGK